VESIKLISDCVHNSNEIPAAICMFSESKFNGATSDSLLANLTGSG